MHLKPKRTYAALVAVAVAAGLLAGTGAASAHQDSHRDSHQDRRRPLAFERTATYPVFQNRPAGEDPASPTVAEISAASEDGRTLVHTDAAARRIGFLDISDADRPRGLGTLSLAELGNAEDEPPCPGSPWSLRSPCRPPDRGVGPEAGRYPRGPGR